MSKLAFSLTLVFSLAWVPLRAQAPVGTISGTVMDETGAVVPTATITVTNKTANVTRTLTANSEGLYSVAALASAVLRGSSRNARLSYAGTERAGGRHGSTTTVDMALSVARHGTW